MRSRAQCLPSASNPHISYRAAVHDGSDARRRIARPTRSDHQIVAGFGAVLLADFRELVGARVTEGIDPEAITEIRHPKDNRAVTQIEPTGSVNDVLVRASYETLVWC